MSDSLIPPDSPSRRMPTLVDQRTILFLDGIRYSIEIAELTFQRLSGTLSEFRKAEGGNCQGDNTQVSQLIVAAMSDAWMLVDSVHRLRELIQQTPRIKQNDPPIQLFIRQTRVVEELRHFIQHLRSGISSFVDRNMPLWGTLSWGEIVAKDASLVTHIIVPGTYYKGVWAAGVTVDTQAGVFCERLVLTAGAFKIDLAEIFDRVVELATWYKVWFESTFKGEPRHSADALFRITMRPRPVESSQTPNVGAIEKLESSADQE